MSSPQPYPASSTTSSAAGRMRHSSSRGSKALTAVEAAPGRALGVLLQDAGGAGLNPRQQGGHGGLGHLQVQDR